MKTFFLILTLSIFSNGAELRSAKALKTQTENGKFTANLDSGYHFNEKAPNGAQISGKFVKPTAFEKQHLEISPLPAGYETGIVHLYVCDDKVTFCDTHKISLGSKKAKAEKAKSTTAKVKYKDGFLLDNFEAALEQAQKGNKIILVDFGAIWCPACLRLEDEIFKSADFKKLTADIVKVKIDVDVFSSKPLQERYDIKGFPTILFTTAQGDEITRFIDYQPMSFIENIITDIKKDPRSLADMEKASPVPESLWQRYFYSDQYAKALPLMEKLNPKPKEYWFAKVSLAKEGEKPKYIETLKQAVKANPESTRALNWKVSLISLSDKKEEKEKLASEVAALTEKLLADKSAMEKATATDFVGEYTGLEGFYVAQINAQAAEEAEYRTGEAWLKVIEQGDIYKIGADKPGAALRLLSGLIQAKKFEQALDLVNSLLKKDPQDGDLQRRKMRVLFELKKYKEAIQAGEKALKKSYGANEFFVVETLAKSYVALGKKDQAKKLVDTYLSKNEINFKNMAGIKKKLEELKATL